MSESAFESKSESNSQISKSQVTSKSESGLHANSPLSSLPTPVFVPGLELCQSFYREAVAPILAKYFPSLPYSAALIGSGSEVLGFDTEMSSDHHWGPRAMIFLADADLNNYGGDVKERLSQSLPRLFQGYPTGYTSPDSHDKGVQLLDYKEEGAINHRVELFSLGAFFHSYIGLDAQQEIEAADWLTLPEQKLRSLTAGRVFHDDLGLSAMRQRLEYYPPDVWLYLLASCWARIEQDEHLMGRSGSVEDELGSAIIAARLVRDLMRLCFLMEKVYAPYPKWFGTAFGQLMAASYLEPVLLRVLRSSTWQEREQHLSTAYQYIARLHNALGITEPLPEKVVPFFDRPFLVISMGAFSQAIAAKISQPELQKLASGRLIGNIDLISDSTDILADPTWRSALRQLYS